ncbi:MAG: amidohydrolase family protein [Planctomycetota bacterium]|jgi:imidazolonepropionase-like amidohydrolase
MKQRVFVILALLLSPMCHWLRAADSPETYAIRAGKIWTITDGVITDGVILIKDGKIDAVGKNPEISGNVKILEMQDKNVMPGMIDAHCHIGLSLDILGEIDETVSAVTPEMQILDAFNPLAEDVKRALRSGVTTVMLAPGYKNPTAGQTAIVKLYGAKTNDRVLKRNAGIKFSLGNEALMFDRRPTSRAGLITLIREELDKGKSHSSDKFDPRAEILKRVAEGELPVYLYCNTADEIVAAVTIVDEYKLKATLISAREADEVASMIAERNVPVIYAPLLFFSKDKDLKRVVNIAGTGTKIAFASNAPITDLSDLRTSAIIAAKYGLNPEIALKSLTINAAEILGIAQRVGSIERGKDADLVILNGDPLELTSRVEMVIINGKIVYQREEK